MTRSTQCTLGLRIHGSVFKVRTFCGRSHFTLGWFLLPAGGVAVHGSGLSTWLTAVELLHKAVVAQIQSVPHLFTRQQKKWTSSFSPAVLLLLNP